MTERRDGLLAWIRERPIIFLVLFIAVCATRLIALGERAIMHDEALFTYYTYEQYYRTLTYDYMPILHGPAHLILQSFIWHIFGVTDFTMRLQVALLGIAGIFWVISFRPWLGRNGTWFAAAFYVLSPGITFFQRFFREDGLFLFTTLWIVASGAHWWRTREPRWIASFIFAVTVLFCNKESSLFVFFSVATFLLLFLIVDATRWMFDGKSLAIPTADFMRPVAKFPNPLLCAFLAWSFVTLCLTRIFEGIHYDADVVQALQHDFALAEIHSIPLALGWSDPVVEAGAIGTPGFWRFFYVALFLLAYLVFAKLKFIADRRVGHAEAMTQLWERIHAARWHIAGALAGSLTLYLAIFSTFFTHPMGPFEIYRETWTYWGGQHEWGRIAGPFHMHSVNLLVYELPAVLVVAFAWVIALLRVKWERSTVISIFLIALPAAAFHVILFRSIQWIPTGADAPESLLVSYFKWVIRGVLLLGALLLAWPRTGRILVPMSLVALTLFSISYFDSETWGNYLASPLLRKDAPVEMMGRQMNGGDLMEILLNMDRGWNLWYVMILVVFATVLTWRAIEDGRRFHAFLIWWFVTSLGAASYAREAVPQVGIHAALPLILLAGSYVDRLIAQPCLRRWGNWWMGALVIGLLWNAKANFILNFVNGADAREKMAYCPTGTELREHAKHVVDYANRASLRSDMVPRRESDATFDEWMEFYNDDALRRDVKILVQGDTVWALRWYLRDVPWTEYGDTSSAIRDKWEFLFLPPEELERQPVLAETYHIHRGRVRTFWTPDPLSVHALADAWLLAVPGQYRNPGSAEASRVEASRAEWRRLWRYLWFREVFDGAGRQYPSLSTTYYLFCVRKDLAP